jgi:hypothetical protein
VLNAITTDDELVDELVNEPTVTNVYRGRHATHHTAPHIPHEGFLTDFLMRNKGFVAGWVWHIAGRRQHRRAVHGHRRSQLNRGSVLTEAVRVSCHPGRGSSSDVQFALIATGDLGSDCAHVAE